jgi:RNA polymerase sigma-70 factor (ECF subfamily)
MATRFEWPDPNIGSDIHTRLSTGDPVASADLAESFLDPLAAWLIRMNRNIDSHLCEQAAEDAILALIKNPHSFQPNRSTLDAYLRMSAMGDLRNLLEREQRHRSRRATLEVVELHAVDRNELQESTDPALVFEREEKARAQLQLRRSEVEDLSLTQEEKNVLELMRRGERKTEAFAGELGIGHLSQDEQRREVKRVKDRVKRRIERAR